MPEVYYSKTEEQQHWLCVILKQRSSIAGSVLFYNRGAAALAVCYSKTEEQQCRMCVILKQSGSSIGCVLF